MRSVFNTPIITPILRVLARIGLRASGWRIETGPVAQTPFVFIGAPHTSNWDFLLLLAFALHLRLRVCWLGKDSLFRFPFGGVMRWLGGIPIDRSKHCNQVERAAAFLREHPELALCVTPEGTRRKVAHWRSGFYHIARLAGVPILLSAIDAEARTVRIGGFHLPRGDAEREIAQIQRHYRGYRGIVRENTGDLPEAGESERISDSK